MWHNIVGHQWAIEVLSRAVTHQRVGHAYLLTGPAQIGKTTLARTLAMAINCLSAASPCGQCRNCQLIAADRHPDVQLIRPEVSARGKPTLKIETIRDVQKGLQLAPYEANYKVAILREFDSATQGAANAFLKTLEEPPEHVVLILTTHSADHLLDTIRSRCRVIPVRPLPLATIEHALINRWHVPPAQATNLAHLANGRIGWAVQAWQQPSEVEKRAEQIDQLQYALQSNLLGRFQLADQLAKTPDTLPTLLNIWLTWWRDLLLISHNPTQTAPLINLDRHAELQAVEKKWDRPMILHSLQQTATTLWQLDRNINTRLALENLLMAYP